MKKTITIDYVEYLKSKDYAENLLRKIAKLEKDADKLVIFSERFDTTYYRPQYHRAYNYHNSLHNELRRVAYSGKDEELKRLAAALTELGDSHRNLKLSIQTREDTMTERSVQLELQLIDKSKQIIKLRWLAGIIATWLLTVLISLMVNGG